MICSGPVVSRVKLGLGCASLFLRLISWCAIWICAELSWDGCRVDPLYIVLPFSTARLHALQKLCFDHSCQTDIMHWLRQWAEAPPFEGSIPYMASQLWSCGMERLRCS